MNFPTTFFGWVAFLAEKYGPDFMRGLGVTLQLATIGTVLGCVLGFVVGMVRSVDIDKHSSVVSQTILRILKAIIAVYVEIFRGTPMMLQAVFIFYALPYFTDNALRFDNIWAASILIVSINTGAYMAESVRGGIISIDPGQTEGAKAIGMTHVQTMVNVIMPQALRNIIPQIGNNFIINIKDTSVMFVIGFVEFFATHRNIVGVNLLYFPSAVIEMAGYLMLTLAASFLLRLLEKRLDGSDNYELVSTDSLAMSAGTYSHPSRKTPFDERSSGPELTDWVKAGFQFLLPFYQLFEQAYGMAD